MHGFFSLIRDFCSIRKQSISCIYAKSIRLSTLHSAITLCLQVRSIEFEICAMLFYLCVCVCVSCGSVTRYIVKIYTCDIFPLALCLFVRRFNYTAFFRRCKTYGGLLNLKPWLCVPAVCNWLCVTACRHSLFDCIKYIEFISVCGGRVLIANIVSEPLPFVYAGQPKQSRRNIWRQQFKYPKTSCMALYVPFSVDEIFWKSLC